MYIRIKTDIHCRLQQQILKCQQYYIMTIPMTLNNFCLFQYNSLSFFTANYICMFIKIYGNIKHFMNLLNLQFL